jgi:predicted nucleic acid-binding protein
LKKVLAWFIQNEQITPASADYLAAATIKATARKQGSLLELPDCLIAAAAVRLGMPLVTGNTGDFKAIPESNLQNWREG